MDVVRKNLTADTISLVMDSKFSNTKKKPLISPNVVVSFIGKWSIPKTTIKLHLPHRPSGMSVCVFVKDTRRTDFDASNIFWQSKWKRDLAADVAISPNMESLPPVTFIPISELKLAYQSFDARRKLAATFDVFLADKRIVHHLPTNLGKAFYGSTTSKSPIPVALDKKSIVSPISAALKCSLALFKGNGTTETVVVGDVEMPASEVQENILSVVHDVLQKWPGGLPAIRSIYVRGVGPSVPLYFDPSDVAVETPPQKRKTAPAEEKAENADMEEKCRILAHKLKTCEAKLPIDAILDVARTLPLGDIDVDQIFLQNSKREKRLEVNRNRSRKAGGLQRRMKHKKGSKK